MILFGNTTYTCDYCGNPDVSKKEVKSICDVCFNRLKNISPAGQGESITARKVEEEINLKEDIHDTV